MAPIGDKLTLVGIKMAPIKRLLVGITLATILVRAIARTLTRNNKCY
jgi:hypothetical protein